MAKIDMYVDDIDGSPEAQTYLVIDPATGKTYAIDLASKNYDKLTKALAFILDCPAKKEVPSVAAKNTTTTTTTPKATRTSNAPAYDKAAYKVWAEANGKWTGKRAKLADIKEFVAQAS